MLSMQHWNGDQLCAIDTETTGLSPFIHEIIQLCILPLDSDILPRKDVEPFYIMLKPEHPERIDKEAMKINHLNLDKLMSQGIDHIQAIDLLEYWFEKLRLPFTRGGSRKRVIPLGQNYGFDRAFLYKWLGIELYNYLFHYHHRDTMCAAAYLNDSAAAHAERVPFSKLKLTYVAAQLNIEFDPASAHDALGDCLRTAEVYRRLLHRGLL